MAITDIASRILDLFAGRRDAFSEGRPHHKPEKAAAGKLEYFPRRRPLEPSDVVAHLKGEVRLGIYPIVDGKVHWFAIDFDGDKLVEATEAWAGAFAAAQAQQQAFALKGLLTFIERSQSGKGAHLWGFLDEATEAQAVRTAIDPMLLDSVDKDLVYPVQAHGTLEFGNLLALPFYGSAAAEGNSVFVDATGTPIKVSEFLNSVIRNNYDVIEEIATAAPRRSGGGKGSLSLNVSGTLDRPNVPLVTGLLKLISPFGCKFLNHCWKNAATIREPEWWVALSQCTGIEHGRAAAHAISKPYPQYDASEVDAKFDRLSQVPMHSCAYIRERWPDLACTDCPGRNPIEKAKVPFEKLGHTGVSPLVRPDWAGAVVRGKKRRSGELQLGVEWGIPGIDRYTRLRPSEFTVIGANPSAGKTAMMVDRAHSLASRNIVTNVFSCETGEIGLLDRFIANRTGINSRRLRGEIGPSLTRAEEAMVERAAYELSQLPLYVNYQASSAGVMLSLTEETMLTNGHRLDETFVTLFDYMQYASTGEVAGKLSEYEKVSIASSHCKLFTKVTQQPFAGFSQLIRSTEGQEAEEAAINQFAKTSRIDADMDEGFILGGTRDSGLIVSRWLANVKGREGESNYVVPLIYHKATSRFESRGETSNIADSGSLASFMPPVGADDDVVLSDGDDI